MNERLSADNGASYELPPEEVGDELRQEVAKEVFKPSQDPARPPLNTTQDSSMTVSQAPVTDDASERDNAHNLLPSRVQPEVSRDLNKQYVEKAKDIISNTASDPHEQKDQISQLAAEYQRADAVREAS